MKFKTDKEYTFNLHYNLPQSRKNKKPQMTIHYRGVCYFVDNLLCNCSTYGYIKDTQPRWVVKGKCDYFHIDDNNNGILMNSHDNVGIDNHIDFKISYNKYESNILNKPQINIFYNNKKITVDNINCDVPLYTEIIKTKFNLIGKCNAIIIDDFNIAHIK